MSPRFDDPDIHPITTLAGVFEHPRPLDRLAHARRAGDALRGELLAGRAASYYASFDLVRVPYPTRYGLRDATWVPTPYLHILNRMFVVQFQGAERTRTLLVSPSDYPRNRETPFFKRLGDRFAWLGQRFEELLAPPLDTVEQALASAGLTPTQVDFITYDHLHTQDVRRWLGDGIDPGVFPNAKLLVTRTEWVSAQGLLPTQRDWYCPGGIDGIPSERVVTFDGDIRLGESVALVSTPGHTRGNHSIAVHTPEGVLVTSENGICADAWAPEHSRIPGLRKRARQVGVEVVMNANTLEGSVDQYVSMVLEKHLAGPSPRNPDFYNVVPSSEMASYWMFPGLSPTFGFGPLSFGAPKGEGER
ncbi:MAG: hypothetical protein H6703_00705 [Myxococcales bacterium]|nr:hypothetical protein [Myxococcales bacterium]